ncbi:hypothetical protein PG994_002082 [Apiospora phragmitis]|uniref:LisH domain-containing protein n=1 Tax=Apiospora phragmitis TaxID=2905665 RepID=A0ABR1WVC3_9PEZI
MDNGSERKPSITPNGQDRGTSESAAVERIDISETKLYSFILQFLIQHPTLGALKNFGLGTDDYGASAFSKLHTLYATNHRQPRPFAMLQASLLHSPSSPASRFALFFFNYATSPFP